MPVSKVSMEWDQSKAMAAAEKITDAATKSTAQRLQRRVERYVPIDTGRLKASIRQYKSKFARGGYAVFAGGNEAFYGMFVEYGTGDRITNGGRYTGRMKANKFMRKAINEEKRAFFAQLEKEFK
jgi:HK97 gp10 family phage protein